MNILDCIGNTPLLHLQRISRIAGANIYAKVETYNPSGSIKDRVAYYYLQEAKKMSTDNLNRCIVEAADGNLGISLAYICNQLDFRLMLCIPASAPVKYHNYLKNLGVHVFFGKNTNDMQGALDEAAYHHKDTWGSFRIKPFTNPDGVKCYYNGLGQELIDDTKKASLSLDAFICGVETGATFTGVGKRLAEENPSIFLGGTELTKYPHITEDKTAFIESEKSTNSPANSTKACPTTDTKSCSTTDTKSCSETDTLEPIFDRSLISETYSITEEDAIRAQKRLLTLEGINACLLSSANIHAALLLAQNEQFKGKNIFIIIHDKGMAI